MARSSPYYYKGGEIFGLHYGSFFSDEAALLDLMRAEEDFMARSHQRLRLWIDFYETRLTDRILVEFAKSMDRLQAHIIKLAIVGCSWGDSWRLRRLARRSGIEFAIPIKFFGDPEDAKTWLVSERY